MNIAEMEFKPFPKMARLSRECIITEKIDGTNAQVCISEAGDFFVGSRTRWITPEADNFGFAAWALAHKEELLKLGPGRHFGEWWGKGIQRNYGQSERHFSLFNVQRWCLAGETPNLIPNPDPRVVEYEQVLPPCVGLVPVLYRGPFMTEICDTELLRLSTRGSFAAPGFMQPEGIVVYHIAARVGFKKTFDDRPKGNGDC